MAGKVANYQPLSFGTGNSSSGSSELRENHSSGSGNGKNRRRAGNIMEEYLSNFLEEDAVIDLLETDKKRGQALQHLDRQFHENNSLLIFQNKISLFNGFAATLADRDKNIRIQCTKLISKIIPQLGNDLDKCLHIVLPKIVANIGDESLSLQKESTQMLHVYMKNSEDVYQILKSIAKNGIRNEDIKTRRQVINTFPTLLFPEFKNEDFFDIVYALALNLSDGLEKEKVFKTLSMVKKFVGPPVFDNYVGKLPDPIRVQYDEMVNVDKRHRMSSSTSFKSLDSEQLSINGDLSNHDFKINLPPSLSASKTSVSSFENLQNYNNNNYRDFENSTYFDSNSMKNSLGHSGSHYRSFPSRSNKENYYSSSSYSEVAQPLSQHYEFGFISRSIIEKFSNPDPKIKLQALEDIKNLLQNLRDISPLIQNMVPLISLLQPLIEDNNTKVTCSALQAFEVIARKTGIELKPFIRPFLNAVTGKFGTNNSKVLSESVRILLHLMAVLDVSVVFDCLWQKLDSPNPRVRLQTVDLITAALLKFSLDKLNTKVLCRYITKMLVDSDSGVRLATLECIAVIAYYMGKNLSLLTNAVDNVELMSDDATGIMAAVQARIVRRQLPRLLENNIVQYASQSSTTPLSTSNSAESRWVNSASTQNSNLSKSMKVLSSNSTDNTKVVPVRRYPRSAGKHRNNFPWTREEEDENNDKHPSSAPVNKV